MTQLTLVGDTPDIPTRVYFATDGANIKIGYTQSLRRRGGALKVHMVYTEPGGLMEERRHQRRWSKYRIGDTEWFRPGDELLLWLQLQISQRTQNREQALLNSLIRNSKRGAKAA